MKTSPKPFFSTFIVLLIISTLPLTSCKEEEADPQIPIVYFQIVLEENGLDLFQSESYSLDSLRLFFSNQSSNYVEITGREWIYIYEADTATFIGMPPTNKEVVYYFDYGNNDIDTLEWLSEYRDNPHRDDIYRIYFNGVFNHEIHMNRELLNDMDMPFFANADNTNKAYPVIKK